MTTLTNSFEGGTPGATITTANSGGASGDPFERAEVDSSLTYTSDSLHGSVAMLASGANDAYVAWEDGIAAGGLNSPELWQRIYFKIAAVPPTDVNILRILSGSNSIMGTVRVNENGTMGMLYSTGSFGGNTTHVLTADTWYRGEFSVKLGAASNGSSEFRLYSDVEGTTPVDGISVSNVTNGTTIPLRGRFGVLSDSITVTMDSAELSDEGWPGPVGTTPPPPSEPFRGWGIPL